MLTFPQACKKFFGQREGQSPMDFLKEVKELTPADRAELAPLLATALKEEVQP